MPAEEIAALYVEMDTLTEEARAALLAEVGRRHMSREQLQKLHAAELRRKKHFDRLQKLHRWTVLSFLLRGDPKWTLITFVVLLGVALAAWLLEHHR